MSHLSVFLALIIITVGVFLLVLLFKTLQFTLAAMHNHQKILHREQVIIDLLTEIRENTKNADASADQPTEDAIDICPKCQKKTPTDNTPTPA